MINELACPNCDVTIYNLNKNEGVNEAKAYGVTALPTVAVNGELLECCKRGPITKDFLALLQEAGFMNSELVGETGFNSSPVTKGVLVRATKL